MKGHRKLLVAVLLALVAGAVAYGLMERPVRVQTAKVERAPMQVTVEEDGKTRVKDRYTITAPVAGYLRRISLTEGDPVTAGQVLAVLEPLRPDSLDARARANAEAGVEAAKAALDSAEENARAAAASADYAAKDYARTKELFGKGVVPKDELDRVGSDADSAEAALRSARFARDVARHELEAARTALEYTGAEGAQAGETVSITSPVAGRVFRVLKKSEGVVAASDAVMEVGDPAAIEVETDLLSADAVKVHPGTRVLFERWGGGPPLDGRVRVVEPSGFTKVSALGVEEQRVWVIADIITPLEDREQLGDGYRVDSSFVIWESGNVLQVPESALFRRDGDWYAFAVRDGRAVAVEVRTGHRNGLSAEVLSGPAEGDEVIVHPGRDVKDGISVKPWNEQR